MKKLIATACIAAAVAAPTTPAAASEPGPIVRTEECPPGYVGRTVYVADRGVLWGCYLREPSASQASPIVRTEECPPGMVGRTIHIGDNTSVRNCYPLPEAPAAAEGSDAWWGRKPCQWGEIGTIIWHDTPATEYDEIRLCIPRIYPDDRTASPMSNPAGVYHCGGTGYIVWYYDLEGRYHEPVNTCI